MHGVVVERKKGRKRNGEGNGADLVPIRSIRFNTELPTNFNF